MSQQPTTALLNFQEISVGIDNFDKDTISTKDDLNNAFDSKEREIFAYLNGIVLRGEYLTLGTCTENLRVVELGLIRFQESNTIIYDNVEISALLLDKNHTFFGPLFHAFSSLIRFIDNIIQKIRFSDKRFYLNESFRDVLSTLNKNELSRSALFELNLFIANCDHFLSISDERLLQRLEEVIDVLKSYSGDMQKEASALKSKSIYLRNKLLFRRVQEHRFQNEDYEIFISKTDGKAVEFDPETYVETNELKPYIEWNRYLLAHYEINKNWRRFISDEVSDEVFSEMRLLDLHRRIKYFKDIQKNAEGLKRIREEILCRLKRARIDGEKFNVYALKICLSYCYNNEFSLVCERSNLDSLVDVTSFYEEIEECAEASPIKNYFIQAKLIQYKTRLIGSYFDNRDTLYENLDKCEELLNVCSDLERKYFEGISWVKQNYNYVFQLPKEECFVEDNVGGSVERVFVYSSFVLPINRSSLHLNLKEDLGKLKIFKASVENLRVTKQAQDEISKLTTRLEESQNEISKRDSKYLEILALFAAIVAFTAGTIPGFKFIDSGIEAIYFTLSLGSSMALFALLFYAINRGTVALKSLKNPLIIGLAVIVVLWTFLFLGSNFNSFKSRIIKNHDAKDVGCLEVQIKYDKTRIFEKTIKSEEIK